MTQDSCDVFERLVRDNQRAVYRVAYSVLGNQADAEDVTQDAFVQAYAKMWSLREPARFQAWVCRIGRRLALNRVRADARARRREALAATGEATIADATVVTEEREFEARVRAAIDRLPDKLREALLLCAIEELDPGEVAALLHIPRGTLRSRLFLARRHLMTELSK